MGRIDRLELENFKSYAGKQLIGPFKSFTAIIGPNGSGKSNLLDAICFVCGVTARQLRGDKLKDLIWQVVGREGGTAGGAGKSASVTLVYVPDDGEMEGHEGGSEVAFTRTISASGASGYRIGGASMDFEAYSRTLESINIVTRARNFLVFQGDVENLAAKDAKSLLAHFEVFCGSAQLKDDYEASLRELHTAREALHGRRNALKEAKAERGALKAAKDEADAYSALAARLEATRVQFALFRLFHLDARIRAEEAALEATRASLTDASAREGDIATQLEGASKGLAKGAKDAAAREKALAGASRASLKASTAVEELGARIGGLTSRIAELTAARAKAATSASEGAAEIASLEGEIAGLEGQLAELEAASSSSSSSSSAAATGGKAGKGGKKGKGASSSSAAAPAADGPTASSLSAGDRSEYHELKASERQQTADLRVALDKLKSEQAEDEAGATAVRDNLEGLTGRKEAIARESEACRDRIAALDAGLAKATAERADRAAELLEARGALERDSARLGEMGRELEEVQAALSAHRDARHRSDNERRVESAVEELRRLFPGVRGRIVELVAPTSKRFNLAVTVALGKHMDAVVVDSEAIAFECVGWLREHKVRPLTFIPLDTIGRKEPSDALTAFLTHGPGATGRHGGHFRLASEVIKFDPEIEPAVLYAVGSTVIADGMDDARFLRFERGLEAKVVTVDGSVIAKNGNMTGGTSSSDRDAAQAGRWDERQVASAKAKRDALLAEEELLRRRTGRSRAADGTSLVATVDDLTAALATNATRIKVMSDDKERAGKRLGELAAEGATAGKNIEKAGAELATLTGRMQARAGTMGALEAKVNGLADAVFGSFCARLGLASIRDFETSVVAKADAEMKARRAVTEALTKLRTKLDYTRSQDKGKTVSELDKRMAEAQGQLSAAQASLGEVQASAVKAQAEEAKLRSELESVKAGQREGEAAREALASQRRAAGEAKAALAKEAAARESALERFASERHEELTKCQMQEIRLPRKGGSGASAGGKKGKGAGASSKRRSRGRAADDEDDEEEEGDAEGGSDVVMSGVFSQDVTATSSQDSDGAVRGSVAEADARRSDRIDYSSLPEADTEEATPARVETRSAEFERRIGELEGSLAKQSPNMKAGSQLEDAERRLKEVAAETETAKSAVMSADAAYASLKGQRHGLFVECFETVSAAIDSVYKEFTTSHQHPMGGTASLTLLNEADPFDPESGVRYSFQPPGKTFMEPGGQSGGEKTVAALALLFAMHHYRPAPFLVMDEIDAALDPVNVHKVASYIRKRATRPTPAAGKGASSSRTSESAGDDHLQALVISLKDAFYEKAQALVGVFRDVPRNSSGTLTLDLEAFPAGAPSGATSAAGSAAGSAAASPAMSNAAYQKAAARAAASGDGRTGGTARR